MQLSPGQKLGPYEIVSLTGTGGMGQVWRAHDPRLRRDVAIKVSAERFSDSFTREARAAAALNHPNLCTLHDVGPDYLVMELVEGETLADRIDKGRLGIADALAIAGQIAEALECAHDGGVVHRDLKPANVKIKPDGLVKVLDFGLAKQREQPLAAAANVAASMTRTLDGSTRDGAVVGTIAYMSPEQAKGKRVDRRTDIWAFGVVLAEMLTGCRPFAGETPSETLASVMKDAPELGKLPSETPAAIRTLVHRCLEKDPQRRLQHIGEARIVIEDVLSGAVAGIVPPAVVRHRRPWIWMVATALFAAVALLASMQLLLRQPGTQPLQTAVSQPAGSGLLGSFALSPDGRYMVFDRASGGVRRLWLRALNSAEWHNIPGTEEGTDPFWSPDSKHIGFFADGKLKRIAVAGGLPDTITDSERLFLRTGGSWSREGMILFAPSPGALYAVSASGGSSAPVTRAVAGDVHVYPHFLPDGRHFLYTSRGKEAGIYVASLDDSNARRLLSDPTSAIFIRRSDSTKEGYVLLRRNGALVAQPFDSEQLVLTGDAIRLADRVTWGSTTGWAAVDASENGLLAYLSGPDRTTASQLVWFDRRGKLLAELERPGMVTEVSLAPDGKTVALTRRRDDHELSSDIWLRDLTRGVEDPFTTGASAARPVWSPDGKRLAYARMTVLSAEILVRNVDGSGGEKLIVGGTTRKYPTDWSSDGRYLVFTEQNARTKSDLMLLDMDAPSPTATVLLQSEFQESQAQISPDGRWMAYVSDKSGVNQLYVRAFPHSSQEWKVTSAAPALQPRWRGDGAELYYVTPRQVIAVPFRASGSRPDFSAPQLLFETRVNASSAFFGAFYYSPAADGERFLVDRIADAAEPELRLVVDWERALLSDRR